MTLEKRGNHGWIGSFDENSCTSQPIGDRPELHWFDYTKFTPAAYGDNKFIGVNYGSFNYKFSVLEFFSDDDCKNAADGSSNTLTQPGDNGLCRMDTTALGAVVGSVKIQK